jgi:DHA1 family tetracycline resistance protein-like MFS transporter
MMNSLFAYFTSSKAPFYFPGVHFLAGAIFMFLSVVITYAVLTRERRQATAAG